jgi:copper oxidase (laccase) domain-containing protein
MTSPGRKSGAVGKAFHNLGVRDDDMNGELRHRLLGTADGDFRQAPGEPAEKWLGRVFPPVSSVLPPSVGTVVAPRVAFTNRVAEVTAPLGGGMVCPADLMDGAVVTGFGRAVALFNGDCPAVCLYAGDRLAVVHAGYRCLIRENPAEADVLASAVAGFRGGSVRAWIGGGIGPCCWAPNYHTQPEVLAPEGHPHGALIAACLGRTTRGAAGSGKVSVDLYELAARLLVRHGLPREAIDWDTHCTACAYRAGRPEYWSNSRAWLTATTNGRNCFVAWLEPPVR